MGYIADHNDVLLEMLTDKQKETLESLLGEIDEERKLVLESIIKKFARPEAI